MYLFRVAPTRDDMARCNITAAVVPQEATDDKATDRRTAVVRVSLDNQDKSRLMLQTEFDYVVVAEDGAWKVDLKLTSDRSSSPGGFKSLMPGGVAPVLK
jgi:hypothetical protein